MAEEPDDTQAGDADHTPLRAALYAAIDRVMDIHEEAPVDAGTLERRLFGAVQVVLRERYPQELTTAEAQTEPPSTPPEPGSLDEAIAKLRAAVARAYEGSKPGVARGTAYAMTQMPRLLALIVPVLRRFLESPAQQEAAKVAVTRILISQAHLNPRVAAQVVETAARLAQRIAMPREEKDGT